MTFSANHRLRPGSVITYVPFVLWNSKLPPRRKKHCRSPSSHKCNRVGVKHTFLLSDVVVRNDRIDVTDTRYILLCRVPNTQSLSTYLVYPERPRFYHKLVTRVRLSFCVCVCLRVCARVCVCVCLYGISFLVVFIQIKIWSQTKSVLSRKVTTLFISFFVYFGLTRKESFGFLLVVPPYLQFVFLTPWTTVQPKFLEWRRY